jgi:hypothetical protein
MVPLASERAAGFWYSPIILLATDYYLLLITIVVARRPSLRISYYSSEAPQRTEYDLHDIIGLAV